MPSFRVEILPLLSHMKFPLQRIFPDCLDAVIPQGIVEVLGCDTILCLQGIGNSQDGVRPEIQQFPESEVLEGLHFPETGGDLEFFVGDEAEGALFHGPAQRKGVEFQIPCCSSSHFVCHIKGEGGKGYSPTQMDSRLATVPSQVT